MSERLSIGLDVGGRHINMVELTSDQKGWKLLDFASTNLGSNLGLEEKLGQLKMLVQEKGLNGQSVNLGVCGEAVIVRYIELPKMEEKELAQALEYEAQQYIPFKMEEVIFDYHILQTKDLLSNRMKILLVAAKKQSVLEFVDFIKRAGLKPHLIDVNSFSLINCFQFNGPPVKQDEVFALINLEFDLVNINILQGQIPFFTRDISLSEDIVTMQLGNVQDIQLFETIRPLLANLIREIRLSIDYYESEFEKQVGVIYLSGEGSRYLELTNFFNTQLGREIRSWSPVENFLVESEKIDTNLLKEVAAQLALAGGLALRKR